MKTVATGLLLAAAAGIASAGAAELTLSEKLDILAGPYPDTIAGVTGNQVPVYKNRFPMEIGAIFEKHGFIRGGRCYHYDTMHFEYRPELLEIAKRSGVSACK